MQVYTLYNRVIVQTHNKSQENSQQITIYDFLVYYTFIHKIL